MKDDNSYASVFFFEVHLLQFFKLILCFQFFFIKTTYIYQRQRTNYYSNP